MKGKVNPRVDCSMLEMNDRSACVIWHKRRCLNKQDGYMLLLFFGGLCEVKLVSTYDGNIIVIVLFTIVNDGEINNIFCFVFNTM